MGRFQALSEELAELLDDAAPEFDRPGDVLRFYFSGLRDLREEIRGIHGRCDRQIEDLAASAPVEFPGVDADKLRRLARRRVALPDRHEWAVLVDEPDMPHIPYIVLRLLVLHADWREVATVIYKCYLCSELVLRHTVGRPDWDGTC
ncbi:hypothetical protein [Nonomuraea sp. LPB2021202275-12-8]|uniref:hypothetical protein n=1 Tax=Nonomuraea sp. LPB2021202275-12-8 TaxID=3120159 RepID=UPI00300D45B1